MRTMALDVGEKRIGVALSDPSGILATPLTAIQRTSLKKDLGEVLRLATENEAGSILVGIPLSMDGVARQQAHRVQQFCEALALEADIPIMTRDERLSTVEAERRLREGGAPARRRKEMVDAAAAAILLQSYLDGGRLAPPAEAD